MEGNLLLPRTPETLPAQRAEFGCKHRGLSSASESPRARGVPQPPQSSAPLPRRGLSSAAGLWEHQSDGGPRELGELVPVCQVERHMTQEENNVFWKLPEALLSWLSATILLVARTASLLGSRASPLPGQGGKGGLPAGPHPSPLQPRGPSCPFSQGRQPTGGLRGPGLGEEPTWIN